MLECRALHDAITRAHNDPLQRVIAAHCPSFQCHWAQRVGNYFPDLTSALASTPGEAEVGNLTQLTPDGLLVKKDRETGLPLHSIILEFARTSDRSPAFSSHSRGRE